MTGAVPLSSCWLLALAAAALSVAPIACGFRLTGDSVGPSRHELLTSLSVERSGGAVAGGAPPERWLPLHLRSFGASHGPSVVVGVLPRELASPPIVVFHHGLLTPPPPPPSTTSVAPTPTTLLPDNLHAHLDEARVQRDTSERDRLREKLLAPPRAPVNGFSGDDVADSGKAMMVGIQNVAVMQAESTRQRQVRSCPVDGCVVVGTINFES